MKRILLILALICMMVLPVFGQTGSLTTNEYFYLPEYGAYGTDEYDEYNTYMQIADTQIKANKDAFDDFEVSDITDVDLTDIANTKILKYNSTSEKWECEDDSGGSGTVTTSGTPAANDIARFTGATVIEGRSYDEFKADLDLEIGTDIQAQDAGLQSIAELTYASPSFIKVTATDTYAIRTIAQTKTDLSLNNVENTALSTWIGTENITTLGTIGTGVWSGTALVDDKIPNNITIDLATLATTITVTDNESTDENNPICFVANADPDGRSLGIETDGDLHYNPSTGTLTATTFSGTAGYTNLISFVAQTAWRVFYSNTDGDVVELALGDDGTYLESNGAASAPTWSVPAGAGDVSKVGTPVDNQVGVWTGDGTIEGAATLTYDGSNLQLTGDIGATGSRITKGWFADLQVTNAIAGSITGNARGLDSVSNADITIQPNGTGDTRIYAPADVVTTVTAAHTMTIAEAGTVLISCAATPYTITLPTAVGHSGLRYHFIKTDANYFLITLDGDSTETLNYENSTGAPVQTYSRLNTYCAEVTIVSDNANWQVIDEALGQVPMVWAWMSATQEDITNATNTLVELDSEVYDIGSNFNTTTHKFVCPVPGKYQAIGCIGYGDVVADHRYTCAIAVGGTAQIWPNQHSSLAISIYASALYQASQSGNDEITLVAYNDSGTNNVDIAGGDKGNTYMVIKLISKD